MSGWMKRKGEKDGERGFMASVYQQREEGVKSSEYLLIEPRVGGFAKTPLTLPYLSTKREKKNDKKNNAH